MMDLLPAQTVCACLYATTREGGHQPASQPYALLAIPTVFLADSGPIRDILCGSDCLPTGTLADRCRSLHYRGSSSARFPAPPRHRLPQPPCNGQWECVQVPGLSARELDRAWRLADHSLPAWF